MVFMTLATYAASLAIGDDLARLAQAARADSGAAGRRAGVARTTVVRLEGGDGGVSLENVLRVARAFGILEAIPRAFDPYESDVGRLRADEQLPQRVRPRALRMTDDD
jgi:hypothetical protein